MGRFSENLKEEKMSAAFWRKNPQMPLPVTKSDLKRVEAIAELENAHDKLSKLLENFLIEVRK